MKNYSTGRLLASVPLVALVLAGCATIPDEKAAAPSVASRPGSEAPALPAVTARTGWNFPVYDVPADPAVRYGILDNGLKYAIRPNGTPQNQVVLRLSFDVGWIDETDEELNAAHFIEHMAFNGSTNIPEGEMIKLLEREGLSFGADTNASTFYEETTYKLDLPRNDAALIDTGLMLMREIASELTITPEAVDRERGILQSEIQTNAGFVTRMTGDFANFLAPATIFAKRTDAGDAKAQVTATITAERLRAIYERYYRPDNATLVIVGDVNPDAIEQQIRAKFSGWERSEGTIPEVQRGEIDFDRALDAQIFVDPAVDYMTRVVRLSPYEKTPDTVAALRREMLRSLGSAIVNRRIQRIARDPQSPIRGGSVAATDYFDRAHFGLANIIGKEGMWKESLTIAEQELRRAATYGFTQAEVSEALSNMETGYRSAADRQGTRPSASLADAILGTVREQNIFETPAARLTVFESVKASLTADAILAEFRNTHTAGQPLIHVVSKTPVDGGEDAVIAAYNASREVPVAAPVEEAAITFAYDNYGTPGTIVQDVTEATPEFRRIRFANNVMLNLKTTDFKDEEIRFHVRVGSGILAIGREEPGAAMLLNSMSVAAGLGRHSIDDLQRILAGQTVSLGLGSAPDHFHSSGVTRAEDFLRQMQVSAAFVTDPGYRPEAGAQWQAAIPSFAAQMSATPQSVAQTQVPRIVANGDLRFGVPDPDTLLGTSLEDLRKVMTPQLADAPIEITVVGDMDQAAVIEAVARTFGALPQRKAMLDDFAAARRAVFAEDRSPRTLYHTGVADQGLVQVFWPTTDDADFEQEMAGNMLSAVLRLKLLEILREELGATYTPNSGLSMSDTFDDFGYLVAAAIVAPENQARVFEVIDQIARDLRDKPVEDDLIARARNPMLEKLAQDRRENSYWLSALEQAQLKPERLARTMRYEDVLRAVTAADIQAFARKYLRDDERLRVAIVPTPAAK